MTGECFFVFGCWCIFVLYNPAKLLAKLVLSFHLSAIYVRKNGFRLRYFFFICGLWLALCLSAAWYFKKMRSALFYFPKVFRLPGIHVFFTFSGTDQNILFVCTGFIRCVWVLWLWKIFLTLDVVTFKRGNGFLHRTWKRHLGHAPNRTRRDRKGETYESNRS